MPDPVTPTAEKPKVTPVDNPWAEFGLNPDGTPIEVKKPAEPVAQPAAPVPPDLTTRLAALEKRLSAMPDGFEGVGKKLDLVDRLVKAVAGDGEDTPDKKYKAVWEDFKAIAPPNVRKVLDLAEKDPDFMERAAKQSGSVYMTQVMDLNTRAHQRMLELGAKAGLKSKDSAELSEMLFPFEQTITAIISANPELRAAYLGGDLAILEPIFQRLYRPFLAQRLRDKQARMNPAEKPPKSAPSSGGDEPGPQDKPKRPDISTPQGRALFHKAAVGRWMDKQSAQAEES